MLSQTSSKKRTHVPATVPSVWLRLRVDLGTLVEGMHKLIFFRAAGSLLSRAWEGMTSAFRHEQRKEDVLNAGLGSLGSGSQGPSTNYKTGVLTRTP